MEAVRLIVVTPLSLACDNQFSPQKTIQQFCTTSSSSPCTTGSRRFVLLSLTTCFSGFINLANNASICLSAPIKPEFLELPDSGGVKALELRVGDGDVPVLGDKVAIHYYGRLAAKQGWRFDSTYDHKDETGEAIPFEFVLGSGKVISGIESAIKSMKVGSIRRVIIPPSEGYQTTSQEPLPPNVCNPFDKLLSNFLPTRHFGVVIHRSVDMKFEDVKKRLLLNLHAKQAYKSIRVLPNLSHSFTKMVLSLGGMVNVASGTHEKVVHRVLDPNQSTYMCQ